MKSGSLFNNAMNANSWGARKNVSSSQNLYSKNFDRSNGGGGGGGYGGSGNVVGQSIMGFNANNQNSLFSNNKSQSSGGK